MAVGAAAGGAVVVALVAVVLIVLYRHKRKGSMTFGGGDAALAAYSSGTYGHPPPDVIPLDGKPGRNIVIADSECSTGPNVYITRL